MTKSHTSCPVIDHYQQAYCKDENRRHESFNRVIEQVRSTNGFSLEESLTFIARSSIVQDNLRGYCLDLLEKVTC